MRHEEAVVARMDRDREYREARESRRVQYEFRRALIGARLDAGLTQTELARLAGLPRSTITRLEAGEGNPTVETLRKLANVLSVQFQIDPSGVHIERELAMAD